MKSEKFFKKQLQKTVSKNLKRFRKKQKLSKAQIAEKLETPRSNITRWELDTIPSLEYIIKLAEIYSVPVETLISEGESCDGFWESDEKDVVYYVNRGIEDIAGIPQEQITGTPLKNFPENTLEFFMPYYKKAKRTLKPTYYKAVPIITPSGRSNYQSGWLIPQIRDGCFDGMVCTVEDDNRHRKTRTALQKIKEKFHILTTTSALGAFQTDVKGNYVHVNRRWCEISGLSTEDAMAKGWSRGLHPDDSEYVLNAWRQAVKSNGNFEMEYRFKTSDGKVTWVIGYARIMSDNSGESLGYWGTILDITKYKRANETLRKSRAEYQDFYENAFDMFASVDAKTGKIIRCNNALLQATGCDMEEIIGRHVLDIYNSNSIEKAKEVFDSFLAIGRTSNTELQIKKKNGTEIKIEAILNASAAYDEEGNISYGRFVWHDISERKRAKKENLDSKILYENILDEIVNGVWVSDKNDFIYYVNSSMLTIACISEKEFLKPLGEFPENTLESFMTFYREAKQALRPSYYREIPVITPSGMQSYQSGWLIPLIKNDNFDGMICTVEDVTERKKTKEELHKKIYTLGEKVKELGCLYNLSKRAYQPDLFLKEILQSTVNLIPSAWQYPEIICARIIFKNKEFKTSNFEISEWRQSTAINDSGEKTGLIEVYYTQEQHQANKLTFLKTIADLLERIIKYKK